MIGPTTAELVVDNHLLTPLCRTLQRLEVVTRDAGPAVQQHHWISIVSIRRANPFTPDLVSIHLNPQFFDWHQTKGLLSSTALRLEADSNCHCEQHD